MDEDSPEGEQHHVSEAMEKAKEVLGSPLYEESKFFSSLSIKMKKLNVNSISRTQIDEHNRNQ